MTPSDLHQRKDALAREAALANHKGSVLAGRKEGHAWNGDDSDRDLGFSTCPHPDCRLVREPEPESAELNAWRELGDEMGRIVSMMTPEDAANYLPDWFGPRLFDLQVKPPMSAALDARVGREPAESDDMPLADRKDPTTLPRMLLRLVDECREHNCEYGHHTEERLLDVAASLAGKAESGDVGLSVHRCKICGTRWLHWPTGWNLLDQHQRPGSCCDNAVMGDQIEYLRDLPSAGRVVRDAPQDKEPK